MRSAVYLAGLTCAGLATLASHAGPVHSVARQWNDENLEAIRNDYARPTIHARNLYHVAAAMWDAWAAYDPNADGVINQEVATAVDIEVARAEAVSFAAYRVLVHRYTGSPGETETMAALDALMLALGYDKDNNTTVGDNPPAVGNRCANGVIAFGFGDGANEAGGYENLFYEPVNLPLLPDFPGNPDLTNPNRWQPLALEYFVDQGGNPIPLGYPEFLSPEWGIVTPFSLDPASAVINHRDGFDYWVFHDPGPPPYHNGVGDEYYRWGAEQVAIWSGHCDPADNVMWDISPASIGNSPLAAANDYENYYDRTNGGDWGTGYKLNPVTGQPYTEQLVPRGDYARILAEFWADGPDSETPPGHWFAILNFVADELQTMGGPSEPAVGSLEWDVKAYLAMGGAMHDVAIAAWAMKGWYDYIRPISAIRWMCDQGQSSDPFDVQTYHADGIRLVPGSIEVVTSATTMPGERHAHLLGHEDKIALYAWRGPDYINDPLVDVAGVGWILAENWWPYQRPSFVTPPFAGYVSGHSTYSRAAALIMEYITGSPYFPNGLGEFEAPMNEFLVFEDGPSMNVTLQWASYKDASDQCSLSRIWGGIHPGADDIPGRHIGEAIAPDAWCEAEKYYRGQVTCPSDTNGDGVTDTLDFLNVLAGWGGADCAANIDGEGDVDTLDFLAVLAGWGSCP